VRILVELSDFNDGTNATKMSKFMYFEVGFTVHPFNIPSPEARALKYVKSLDF
jgi:hypothetical protein